MSKVIQIRDVPDETHAALARAAADRGLSLTRYLVEELDQVARLSRAHERNAAVVREGRARLGIAVERDAILTALHEGREE